MWSHFLSLLKVICFTTAPPPPRANYDVCNLLATKLIMIRISQCAACFDRWFPSGRPLHNYLIINYILFLLKLFATSWSFCCQISTTDSSHEHISLKTSNEQLWVICPIRQSRSTSVVNLMYLTDCFSGIRWDYGMWTVTRLLITLIATHCGLTHILRGHVNWFIGISLACAHPCFIVNKHQMALKVCKWKLSINLQDSSCLVPFITY